MKYLVIKPGSKLVVIPMSSGLVNHVDSLLLVEQTWDSKTSAYKYKLLHDQTVEIELVEDTLFTPAEPLVEKLQGDLTSLRSDWCVQFERAGKLAKELTEANEKLTKITTAATSV